MIIEKNYFIDSEFLPLGHSPVISGSSDKWGGGAVGSREDTLICPPWLARIPKSLSLPPDRVPFKKKHEISCFTFRDHHHKYMPVHHLTLSFHFSAYNCIYTLFP